MSRLNSVVYHANNQTADIGAGNLWDNVYQSLAPFGVNVAGGRISGELCLLGFELCRHWLMKKLLLLLDQVSVLLASPSVVVSVRSALSSKLPFNCLLSQDTHGSLIDAVYVKKPDCLEAC